MNDFFRTEHSVLRRYTIVAQAMETIHDVQHDEIDGAFVWVVYHNDANYLNFARVDLISGNLDEVGRWHYTSPRDYAEAFAAAMALLYERTTGRDFSSAAPRR